MKDASQAGEPFSSGRRPPAAASRTTALLNFKPQTIRQVFNKGVRIDEVSQYRIRRQIR